MVVTAGVTDGFELVEVNPAGILVQEYSDPMVELAPILIEFPSHIELSPITVAVGSGFIVIVKLSETEQRVLELVIV